MRLRIKKSFQKKRDALAPIEGKILLFFLLKNKRFGMIVGLAPKKKINEKNNSYSFYSFRFYNN